MVENDLIKVELVYINSEQFVFNMEIPIGSNIYQAIIRSGVLEKYPEIDTLKNRVGVFNELASLETILHDGDRVEIYRPLQADPKEARRRRAAKNK